MSGVAGILLAAGRGSRMGTPKALLEWNGTLLVDHGIDLLTTGGCDPVLVVLGAALPEVRRRARLEATVVVADHWLQGMGSSLTAGLLAAETTDAESALVALVDQPFVSAEAIRRLIDAHEQGARVAVAEYAGKPRNPVLFARGLWPEIREAVDGTDEGARQWLKHHAALATAVDCTGTGSPQDLDTPADLTFLRGDGRDPGRDA